METRKVLSIIFSIVFLAAFGFVLSWGIINFNKVQNAMSGTQIYDSEDLDKAYNDGYDTALENKKEYDALINGYRDNITSLNDTISQLNSQIITLQNTNKDCNTQIQNLNDAKTSLESEITRLNENKSQNEKTIDSLNNEITDLNTQITNLNNTILANELTINSLNNQIVSLNTQIANLNQTITTNEQTISGLRININELNARIEELSNNAQSSQTEIAMLNNQIASMNEQIDSLQKINRDYMESINNLEAELSVLKAEKDNLILENTNYYNTISSLNNQIVNLQNVNSQLESTNTLHLNTISSLNSQITSLNQQISDITHQSQNNNSTISSLNAKITELEESVRYYENYISSLESEQQVVATFEYDGSVYNIQVVNKGSTVAVNNPQNTAYITFNGWKVDNQFIDLSTFTINENTKIVADLTYKYDVIFKVDNSTYNSQIIEKNNYAAKPTNPTKAGYEFDGWSTDNVNIIEVSTNSIVANTTYHAVFTKLHTVSFVYEDTTKSTQTIRNGNTATSVNIDNTNYKVFNGWKVNGSIVDVATYKITTDTTFVADITYKYDVIYKVDDAIYNSQIITKNNYPSLPSNPTKPGYEFDGWSLNGVDVINTSTLKITNNTTYYAVFTKVYNVSFIYEGTNVSLQTVRENNIAKVVNVDSSQYKVFNGWKVNNEIVNINEYPISKDTTFVADITYKYDVIFKVDGGNYNTQLVEKTKFATLPTAPTKAGYQFDGWTINGVDIINNIETTQVNANITYIAKFTQVHTVKFMYDNQVISTQTIRNSEFATAPNIEENPYIIFNGWMINNAYVDISSYRVISNVTITANITYRYDVIYMSDGVEFAREIVTSGNYATLQDKPTKDKHNFDGWTLDGTNVISINNYQIKQTTTFVAKFCIAEGLFDEDDKLVMSWDDMIANNYIAVDEAGVVSQGTAVNRESMASKLLIPEGITGIASGSNAALGVFYNCANLKSVTLPTTLTSIGKNAFNNCTGLTEIIVKSVSLNALSSSHNSFYNAGISDSGINVIFTDTVEKIPAYLFLSGFTSDNSPKVTSVSIGKNVATIGSYFISYGKYLETITIPGNVKIVGSSALMKTALKSIVISEGVEELGANMFDGCTELTSLTIPNSLLKIGTYSFNCIKLQAINVGEQNTVYTSIDGILYTKDKTTLHTFPAGRTEKSFTVPDFVTKIESSAFRHTQNLETVVVPDTVTSIGSYAFYGALALKSVNLPSNITSIVSYMFGECPKLTSFTIPSTVTSIGLKAFYRSGLTRITIPNSVTQISDSAFKECASLSYVNLGTSLTTMGDSVFEYCTALTSITIPDSVTKMEYYAFRYCESLQTATIGSGLTLLDSWSFGHCTSLTSVTFKAGLKEIDTWAFSGCTALTTVNLPSTLETIGMEAFEECTSLKTIIIPESVTYIDSRAFQYCTSLKGIYIPSAVDEIDCYSYSYSIVLGCSPSLVIYTNASSATYYWGDFNYIAQNTTITVKYNQSLASFKSAMGI